MEKIVQTVFFNNGKPPYLQDWSVCQDHYKPFLQAWTGIISHVIRAGTEYNISSSEELIPVDSNAVAFSQGRLFNI